MSRHTITEKFPCGLEGDGFDVEIEYDFTPGGRHSNTFGEWDEPPSEHEIEFFKVTPKSDELESWPYIIMRLMADWAAEMLATDLYNRAVAQALEDLS